MNGLVRTFAVLVAVTWTTASIAQNVTEGPLAPSGAGVPTVAPPKPSKPKHASKVHRSEPLAWHEPGVPSSRASDPTPVTATDPVTLGMKWQGNTNNAVQTRASNYDGNAIGTGAEVGLKLHF